MQAQSCNAQNNFLDHSYPLLHFVWRALWSAYSRHTTVCCWWWLNTQEKANTRNQDSVRTVIPFEAGGQLPNIIRIHSCRIFPVGHEKDALLLVWGINGQDPHHHKIGSSEVKGKMHKHIHQGDLTQTDKQGLPKLLKRSSVLLQKHWNLTISFSSLCLCTKRSKALLDYNTSKGNTSKRKKEKGYRP